MARGLIYTVLDRFELWGLILWVLDAFRPRSATWSGQGISSPPAPSGGPFMTQLLPGGGVPRVHGARSPVPPRLPLLTTPRSVHQSAAVAAGAYPPRRPPNAWSPGVPALPGSCYWLVASGTPLGWCGGCLAVGLVRGGVRHYFLGGCSALVVCARRSRPVRGGWGWCQVLCLPRFPLPAPHLPRCVWRAVPSGCPLSSLAGTPFHAVCAFRGLGPVALLVFPACPLGVRALALSRRPRPPPPGSVWRAHLARSRCWAPVGPFHAVRAPPRVLPRSRAPFGLLGGGGGLVPFPPCLAWGCVPPLGRARVSGAFRRQWGGGRGAACVPSLPEVRPGGPKGRGVALPRSVPLPSLGRQQSRCHWCCSGHGGSGPHTAPVCVRMLSPGVVRVASLCAGMGSLACRGPHGSRHVGAWGRVAHGLSCVPPTGAAALSGGGGTSPLPWGGWRAGALVARGPEGGGGGRGEGASRRGSPPPSSRGVACGPRPRPPFFAGAFPPGILVQPGSFGSPGRRARPGRPPVGQPGGGGGSVRRPPSGARPGGRKVSLPQSVSPPSPGGHQGWLLRLCPALHTALAHVRVPPSRCSPRGALERRRRAAGLPRALREWVGGLEAVGVQAALAAAVASPPGCRGPPGGGGGGGGGGGLARRGGDAGPPPPWLASGCPQAGGERAGGRGGLPIVPPRSPGAAPRRLQGGGLVVLVPGGQPSTEGGALLCCPPPPFGRQAVVRALTPGPPALLPAAASWLSAGWQREGGRVGGCWRWQFGSVVSG